MFGFRSARGRAILAGAVLIVLLAGVATLAAWRAHDDQRRHHELEQTSATTTALEHARAQFYLEISVLAGLVFSQDPTLVDQYDEAKAALAEDLTQARAGILAKGDPDSLATLDDLTERRARFEEMMDLAVPFLLTVDATAAAQLASTYVLETWTNVGAIMADLDHLAESERNDLAASRAAADRAADTTLWLLIGFGAAAFLVAAGTVAVLIVSLVRPLASLQASARAITSGDLEARAEMRGPEEVTSLARAFNEMTDALAAKTKEYIDTANLTGDIIARLDKDGNWAFLNDAACQFYGKPREELLGTDSRASVHPDDLKPAARRIRETAAGKELHKGFINRQITPMGTRAVEWNGYPLFDEEGQYAGIQITGRDITERKQMEEALQGSQARWRSLVENSPDTVMTVDADGRIQFINRVVPEVSGDAEVIGSSVYQYVPPEYHDTVENSLKQVFQTGEPATHEVCMTGPQGMSTWYETRVGPVKEDGQVVAATMAASDITERKQMEQVLRESEERYRSLVETSADAIILSDLNTNIIMVNDRAVRLLGYSNAEEVIGRNSLEFIAPEDRQRAAQNALRTLQTGAIQSVEYTILRKDGTSFPSELSASSIVDAQGRPQAFTAVVRDITERKRAEEALRSSEERLRILFESAPDAYYLNDLQGNFVDGNRAAEELTGYTREELLGKNMLEVKLLPPEQIAKAAAALAKHVRGLPSGPDEFILNRKDGSRVPVEIRSFPVEIEDQTLVLGIARDISERKKAEEERERLHAELEVRAITDSLTGLYNHAHFFQRLTEEIERSNRYNHGFALVMMDVDAFKHYNDSRGHQAGDVALHLIADSIRTALRRSDTAFRYGGDEFAAILPHADSSRAQAVVNRINRRIAARLKEMNDPAAAWLGISAGVACSPDDGATPDELVRAADAALYNAKRVAWARAATEREQAIELPPAPSETPDDKQPRLLCPAARELAQALQDLSAPDALAELDLRTIAAIGAAAEIKDPYIRDHQERVSRWAAVLAEEMGLSPEQVQDIRVAGLLHDIGKVSVSEHILNKPGKLTEEEYAQIKEHATLGAMVVGQIDGFERLVPIIRHHHERFDGKGYPDGLAGEDIPLEAHILSVVDVFDAMTHHRSYRKALSREKAVAELQRGAGTQFDPTLVKAFLALMEKRGEEPPAPARAASTHRQLAAARAPGQRKG